MQSLHQKCVAIWPTVLSNLKMKFNFAFNHLIITNVYHQKFCKKNKNIKIDF